MAPFMLRCEDRECMEATLADKGGRLVSVLQAKAAKKYRVEVTADLADGSRRRWYSDGIKYPKSAKRAREWVAEANFAAAWHPTEDGVFVERLSEAGHKIEAQDALPAREKRPRDCQKHLEAAAVPPEKRGGTREGGGRPRGSYGAKRLRELLLAYKAAVDAGLLFQAQIASKKLPAAMLEASLEVEKNSADFDPVFLKRQSNRGVGKKTALRKLRLARSKLAKAALEARACRDHWEHAIIYLDAVEKECLGSAAVVTAGHEESLREFLRIPSVSSDGPKGSYAEAAKWISDYGRHRVGLSSIKTIEYAPGKPVVLMEWPGSQPYLPCVLLNSHYDVVPAALEYWDTDPFGAVKDETNGRIYGRGTQDMKCVCVQYLVAILRLRRAGFVPTRTVHLSFLPDEEVGGADGSNLLIASEEWKELQPVGVALDEGLANPKDAYTVFYGERIPWWLLVRAEGPTGHGSRFIQGTAVEKLMAVCDKALAFRAEQEAELGHSGGCSHARAKKLGDVTTLNLTMLKAGVAMAGGEDEGGDDGGGSGQRKGGNGKPKHDRYALNVIPAEAHAAFDVRISPQMPTEDFRSRIAGWCREEGVTWEFADWTSALDEHYITSLDRDENPWWGVFLDTMKDVGVEVEPEIFPAATDSCFFRELGIPALGFSPMRNTPILLHDHNEYIDQGVFVEGISVYERLISALASAERLPTEV